MDSSLPGILIAIEGIDGAGKTTQVERLANALREQGEIVVSSKEPTNGQHGRRLRESAQSGRLSPEEELEAFIADRREHVSTVIQPAINAGGIVIVDRYFYSTIAYQGVRTGHSPCDFYSQMQEFPTPDVAFLMDLPPEIGLYRISSSRGDVPNEFERLDALKDVRDRFLQLRDCAPEVHVIDASPSVDAVYHEIIHHLVDVIGHKRCLKRYECDMLYCSYRITGDCTWPQERAKLLSCR